MARVLTVPNFSTPVLPEDLGLTPEVALHYARGDVDHGRAVVAFSGEPGHVLQNLFALIPNVMAAIDLAAHTGVHPRTGALDVVPFVDIEGAAADQLAERFIESYERAMMTRVLRYERSSPLGETLPELRRGPGLLDPTPREQKWGATVVGARGFLIAANLDFPSALKTEVANAARELRRRRDAGDPALTGVRALAFDLRSRHQVQLSFNLTRPDETTFDAVAAIGESLVGARATGTELIGVIRPRDLPGATRLKVAPEQVV